MEMVAKEADSSELGEQAGSVIFIIDMDVERVNKVPPYFSLRVL